jgi:hypothetical protein
MSATRTRTVRRVLDAIRPSVLLAIGYTLASLGFALTSNNAGLFTAHVHVSPLVIGFGLATLFCRLLVLFVALPLAAYRLTSLHEMPRVGPTL